jgi:hypothetical protein
MTREEFIKILNKKKYSYEMEGNEILVTHQEHVWLPSLESLPPGVQFQNQGYVILDSLKSLPPGVRFENQGDVWLDTLVGGWFDEEWAGNIEGVDHKRLLNLMIDKKLFL